MVRRARQEGEGVLGWRLVVRTVRMMQSPVSTSLLIPAHGSEDTNLVRVDSDSALLRLRRRGDFIVNQLKQSCQLVSLGISWDYSFGLWLLTKC